MKQKDSFTLGGVTVSTAMRYEVNYREKSPVVACVVDGNEVVKPNDILLCHHNLFYPPSPFLLQDDLFSIPFSKVIFARIEPDGHITPLCGNILCQRIVVETTLPLPPEQQKTHITKSTVVDAGMLKFRPGTTIFHRPNSGYDIVYIWQSIEKRITKVHIDQVCGMAK
jgi:hypothetical protein